MLFASFHNASISNGVIALRSMPRDAAIRATSSNRATNLSQAAAQRLFGIFVDARESWKSQA
jgi:hypothetical protein